MRDGKKFTWVFERDGNTVEHRQSARLSVNCALTIYRMPLNGAGIGLSFGNLCAPEFEAGRLVRLFSEWTMPSVPVHAVLPSQRQMVPAVCAFVEFMIETRARVASGNETRWRRHPSDRQHFRSSISNSC